MSNPYAQPPKRLVRSTSNRVIGGVCGGVAQYLNMDPNLVRILTVLITLFTGVPVILYIIALFVVPEDTSVPSAPPPVGGPPTYAGPFAASEPPAAAPAYAPYQPGTSDAPRPGADDAVWGSEGPPWEQRQSQPTPAAAPAVSEPAATTEPTQAGPTPEPEPAAASEPVAPSEPEAPVAPPEQDESKDDPKPA